MERCRRQVRLWALLGRLLGETRGTGSAEWAVGAAILVTVGAASASTVGGGFARTAQRIAASAGIAGGREVDLAHQRELEERLRRMQEEAEREKEAAEESSSGFWGSLFGGPVIGTMIGKAIGSPAEDGSEDASSAAEPEERTPLQIEAMPGWTGGRSDDDDDPD